MHVVARYLILQYNYNQHKFNYRWIGILTQTIINRKPNIRPPAK